MMKCLLLLLAGAALATSASAQSLWAAPGATWTYSYALFWEYGDLTMSYAGPTTVAGQPAMRYDRTLLTKMRMSSQPAQQTTLPGLVLRADADRLYVLANDQQFYTLFNFAAQVGDSWLTPASQPQAVCASTLVRLRVDSVGTAVVGGVSRRWLRLRLQTQAGQQPTFDRPWGGRIYEGLGPTQAYLLPQGVVDCGGTDPGYLGGMMCFRATGQPTVYGGSAQQCSSIVTAATEQQAQRLGFEVYPNPSQGELTLRLPVAVGPQATVELRDLTGRCLLRAALPATGKLDVRQLPKGLYALSLHLPDQATPATRRVVLE
ncbi:T9SS type A sorting domain-containing protein [Hymenobacter gummosus]|nr:T9SS type A sorting domain-containing protein [Hymenobacter gummosus]